MRLTPRSELELLAAKETPATIKDELYKVDTRYRPLSEQEASDILQYRRVLLTELGMLEGFIVPKS